MKMKCNKCGRAMYLAEFISYPEAYLVKLLREHCVTFLIKVLQYYTMPLTRSSWDNHMAGLANSFDIKCPVCTNCSWDPVDEELELKQQKIDEEKKKAEETAIAQEKENAQKKKKKPKKPLKNDSIPKEKIVKQTIKKTDLEVNG